MVGRVVADQPPAGSRDMLDMSEADLRKKLEIGGAIADIADVEIEVEDETYLDEDE